LLPHYVATMVVQWTPGRWGPTVSFFKYVAVCGIVLLVIQYFSSIYDHNPDSHLSPAAQRQREYISHVTTLYNHSVCRNYSVCHNRPISDVTTLYNYSIGLVWPRSDVDDDDDRILSQIDVMNVYGRQKRNRKLKVILRVGNFNFETWVAGQEQFVRDGCPIVDCWMTNDQSQARDADALLISEFRDSSRRLYLPKPRRQIWIAQHWESPLHNRIDPNSVRGLINWTASYRRDSTIVFRYEKMIPTIQATASVTSSDGSFDYASGKTKLVAWFVSNCNAGNQRMRYAQELSKFIQV